MTEVLIDEDKEMYKIIMQNKKFTQSSYRQATSCTTSLHDIESFVDNILWSYYG